MRVISLLLTISIVLFCTSCSNKSKVPASEPSASQSESLQTQVTDPTAMTMEHTYLIGTVVVLEDDFVYVRADKSTASDIVGAAVLGAEFEITECGDTWCKINYYDDQVGYIQTKCINQKIDTALPSDQHLYYYLPSREEMGLVETKFDNKLTVKLSTYTIPAPTEEDPEHVEILPCIDIYTVDGTLLAANATLVLHEATITAPVLVDPFAPQQMPAVSEPITAPEPIDPLLSPTEVPNLTPTPPPIEIVVLEGKVTSSLGIALAADPEFVIGEDLGKVIAEDGTVVTYEDYFLVNASISISYGTIYSAAGQIIIEPEYFFVPTLLENNLVDVAQYSNGIVIDQLLATDNNMLGYNVYGRSVCLLQKGTLDKLNLAQEKFQEDGYSIIIYDAYRPYSVTVLLYEKYKNGTYVAGPRIGSVHNKGAAVDMSIVDKNGIPLEMPSPIHTLDATSNRNNPNMTDTAKANMEYMASVMRSCGFSTINSEWWHFSDTENIKYLRTDYDLTTVLEVVYPAD